MQDAASHPHGMNASHCTMGTRLPLLGTHSQQSRGVTSRNGAASREPLYSSSGASAAVSCG